MGEEKGKKIYCTNMKDNDPVIEKFIKEYLKEKEDNNEIVSSEDLIVNFDITYADGVSETHTCGSESKVFGGVDDGCIENKIDAEEMKCYFSEADIEVTAPANERIEEESKEEYTEEYVTKESENYKEIKEEIKEEIKCNVEEYIKEYEENSAQIIEESEEKESDESSLQSYFEEDDGEKWLNCEDEWNECNKVTYSYEKDEKCKCIEGQIIVYSTLNSKEGTRVKGVKINLYRLNGISPELVDSKETDCDGKAIFSKVLEGSYRIIELIDKRYFEKPSYINWNEVTIDECNTKSVIYSINKIKNQKYNKRYY